MNIDSPIPTAPPQSSATMRARIPGLAFALALGLAGLALATIPSVANLQLSALTIAIVLGMVAGNAFGTRIPASWTPGIAFAQRTLLRAGVVLYGLRISFQQIAMVGPRALVLDVVIVASTLAIGVYVGRRWLGLDRDTALLTACGSAICGAAAVLAAERVLKPDPSKVAIAVATVVLFGTLDVFLYPEIAHHFALPSGLFGVYTGATVHEVAQVVAAGNAVDPAAADAAVIVKLTRVLLLVPFLFALGAWRARAGGERGAMTVPWFALAFVAVAALNSIVTIAPPVRAGLLNIDTLLLATAMAALGIETRAGRLRALGPRPIVLALVLFAWLTFGGFWLASWLVGTA
jgi:uncharacterized integral membrane protein (TIGR00698 family)